MVAAWFAVADAATARGTSGSGTSDGRMLCITVTSNARAMPRMSAVARMTLARDRAGQHRGQQGRGRDRLDDLAADQQQAAVVAVGDLPDDEEQQHRRDELDQPDQAEIERIAGQRIKLPADRHDQHLVARRDEQARAPEQHERPVTQDGVWVGRSSWRAAFNSTQSARLSPADFAGHPFSASRYGMTGTSRSRAAAKTGGARRDRTADLVIANDALSQLSYGP